MINEGRRESEKKPVLVRAGPSWRSLLLVSLSLQELPLLVLSHLLAALLDDTTHVILSLPRDELRSAPMFRSSWNTCQPGWGAHTSATCRWAPPLGRVYALPPAQNQDRVNASITLVRTLPRARLTRCRRGKKGTRGSRRRPREATRMRMDW